MFAHCYFTRGNPLAGLLSQEFGHMGGGFTLMEPRGNLNLHCLSHPEQFIIAGIRNSCSLVSKCIYINRLLDLGHIIPLLPAELQPEEGIQHMAPICRELLRKERRHLHGETLYFCLTQNNLLKTQLVKSFQCGSENLIRRVLICTSLKWVIISFIKIVCNFSNWCTKIRAYCFTVEFIPFQNSNTFCWTHKWTRLWTNHLY